MRKLGKSLFSFDANLSRTNEPEQPAFIFSFCLFRVWEHQNLVLFLKPVCQFKEFFFLGIGMLELTFQIGDLIVHECDYFRVVSGCVRCVRCVRAVIGVHSAVIEVCQLRSFVCHLSVLTVSIDRTPAPTPRCQYACVPSHPFQMIPCLI